MRAHPPPANPSLIEKTISAIPEVEQVLSLTDGFSSADSETISAILNEAVKFASGVIDPLNEIGDVEGIKIVNGRVKTPDAMKDYWKGIIEGGWLSLDMPQKYGGQGLPLFLALCVQEIFDRSCPAAGMLPVPNRSAAKLLARFGNDRLKDSWISKLVSGENTATICISEVGAGSDVNRMRSKAAHVKDDIWKITGEKQWISFGDHDLTKEIGHCVLARAEGDKSLSLFFVPRLWAGDENNIFVRRIEEKLGLHLSPTCALGFEGANGWLLGERGRGLTQMFVMIANMRLFVGNQGLGIASGAADVALEYAKERRQGGRGERPVAIIEHADVQRQLMEVISDVETLRGLGVALACHIDISNFSKDPVAKRQSSQLVSWIMPTFKTMGGEIAFSCASQAIQVLGGAGYTREWPVEQALRDSRVLPIFEGTTGIQALDLLHRRLWGPDSGEGLEVFLELARGDARRLGGDIGQSALKCYDELMDAADQLKGLKAMPRTAEASATAFLNLAGLAARTWSATRLARVDGTDSASTRLRLAGEYFLTGIAGRASSVRSSVIFDQKNTSIMAHVASF